MFSGGRDDRGPGACCAKPDVAAAVPVMRAALAALAALFVACASGSSGAIRREVDAAEKVERSQEEQTQRLATALAGLLSDYAAVDAAYRASTERFRAAGALANSASAEFAMARQDYEAAQENYRWIAFAIVVAAGDDVVMAGADAVCSSIESTATYRRRNGVDSSMDVDHAFPHALGGVNSPYNYELLSRHENRALGKSIIGKLPDYAAPMFEGLVASALARLCCAANAAAWRR